MGKSPDSGGESSRAQAPSITGLSSGFVSEYLSGEIIGDLFRSAWLVESARSQVYEDWTSGDQRFTTSARRADERAGLLESKLADLGKKPDLALVESHLSWIEGLVGADPSEVPFGDIFLTRLGDWVDAHTAPFFAGAQGDRLRDLGAEERAVISLPTSLPAPPPFERLEIPDVRAPGEKLFSFGILGDLHFGSLRGERMARAAIADLNAADVDLVIQLGDITDHGHRSEFGLAAATLAELHVPVTTMMGNHDVMSIEESRLSGREYYPQSFGREPDGVILEHKGFRFAVLDSIEIAATPFAPFDLVTGTFTEGSGGAIVRGSLTPLQHELLAEVASPGSPPAFVFLHHPPQPFTAFPPILFGLREEDSGRLHATVDSGNVWGVFAGHTHRNARSRDFDGVPAHEVAIPRDFPFGFGIVDVSAEGYAYRFVQLSDDDLLREGYTRSGTIHRRYGAGRPEERAFTWKKSA